MTTRTIDPAKDVETEAFQTKAPKPDALDNAERVLAVARILKSHGNRIVSINATEDGGYWLTASKRRIELSEADFRRHFKGRDALESPGQWPSLSIDVDGVCVFCSLPSHPVVKPLEKKVVTL